MSELWREQEAERRPPLAAREGRRGGPSGPACYPSPEHSFASYPTAMIGEQDRLVADEDARERLHWLLNIP